MPFVTEECAQRLPAGAPTLQHREWPKPADWWSADGASGRALEELTALATALRARRQEAGLPQRQPVDVTVQEVASLPRSEVVRILEATPMLWARVVDSPPDHATPLRVVAGGAEAALHLRSDLRTSDRAQLETQRERLAARVEHVRGRLRTEGFTQKAPAAVVEGARAELAQLEDELARVDRILSEVYA